MKLILGVLLFTSFYSYSGTIPKEIKGIIASHQQLKTITDRNRDGKQDVIFDFQSIRYDDDYNGIFESKLIIHENYKIALTDHNQDGVFDIKNTLHYKSMHYTIHQRIGGVWQLTKKLTPILKDKYTYSNIFKSQEYIEGILVKEKTVDTIINYGLAWLLLSRQANPLPTYGPNHFFTQFNSCIQNNGENCLDPSICRQRSESHNFIPTEFNMMMDFSYNYSWCEREETNLNGFDRDFDYDRDVRTISSTGLKFTESCPESKDYQIENEIMKSYKNLFNCFNPHEGKFPNATRYESIKRSYEHLLSNGGLKIKCRFRRQPRSGSTVGATTTTYIAKSSVGYKTPGNSYAPYNDDGNTNNAPDADWLNLRNSTYEPSVLTLNYYTDGNGDEVNAPNIMSLMHELLHLPGTHATFPGFRFDNHSTEDHNNLLTPEELSSAKTPEQHQTLKSEKDRVYACAHLCSSTAEGAIPINKKICLRCLSSSQTDDLTIDASAVESCAQYPD